MKILLIEDSRFLRGLLGKTLTKAGYDVIAAEDGQEGLRQAREVIPSLILLDMMLPGLDGTCVLKALKENESTAQIPVVVLTGLSQRNATRLKQAGAAGYIEKAALELERQPEAVLRIVETILAAPSEFCSLGASLHPGSEDRPEKARPKRSAVTTS